MEARAALLWALNGAAVAETLDVLRTVLRDVWVAADFAGPFVAVRLAGTALVVLFVGGTALRAGTGLLLFAGGTVSRAGTTFSVSYTHLTLPTKA